MMPFLKSAGAEFLGSALYQFTIWNLTPITEIDLLKFHAVSMVKQSKIIGVIR